MGNALREIPPTAGLPSRWGDLLPVSRTPLETQLATLLHLPPVAIECSGSAALVIALTTLKESNARDAVVIPAYTCPLVVRAVRQCGLRPVLCDLRPSHFDLCPNTLAMLCDARTLAILPTHLGGRVADLAPVLAVARRCGAWVIEDAAQALGATWRGHPVGTVGDAGFYSLAAGKGLTLYEGGVLMTRDADLRRRMHATSARVAPTTPAREGRRWLQLLGYMALYRPFGLRLAYGMGLRHALRRGRLIEAVGDDFPRTVPLHRVGAWRRAIGARAVRRLPLFLDTLASDAVRRKARLATIPHVTVMADPPDGRGSWPFFMVLMPTAQARDAALARLWTAGLGVSRLFIHALPDYPYLAGELDSSAVPHARDFAARMLTVSNSPWMRDVDFERICAVLEESV
jgi:dTDP-4-amino-4,6-dideoxygalactose transaminase